MSEEKPYHHGNLRVTLLAAAVELVGDRGPKGFTLREVARRAGVSHNAPYRHFASRDELLQTVAEEGFGRLKETMELALHRGHTAADRLQLSGCGYVEFALRWPHHFAVMFDMPHDAAEQQARGAAGLGAFGVLMNCVEDAQAEGAIPAGDSLPLALTAWSLVHGVAKLAVSGTLPMGPERTLEFTWQASTWLMQGLRNASSGK
jgi:AcrR family transcriptional regulator